jgi:hypothetical protein
MLFLNWRCRYPLADTLVNPLLEIATDLFGYVGH